MPTATETLCEIIVRHTPTGTAFPFPGVMFRSGTSEHEPFAVVLNPMLCFIIQGSKRVQIGEQIMTFSAPSMLGLSLHLPLSGRMLDGTVSVPHVGMGIDLDLKTVTDLLADLPAEPPHTEPSFAVTAMEPTMAEPLLRLAHLADTPVDAAVLAPLAIREIIYRTLRGPMGPLLFEFARGDGRTARIRMAVDWILAHLQERLSIQQLADLAGMSVSSFNRHFRQLTAESPLQFIKQARLYQAHNLLLPGGRSVSDIAFSVGYESTSQFSREYTRQFGHPPSVDRSGAHLAGCSQRQSPRAGNTLSLN
jgi:AraC-like DNA-binding protein